MQIYKIMSPASLCCVFFYLAVAPLWASFTEAQNSGFYSQLISSISTPKTIESNRYPVIDGFNITDEFLDFYESEEFLVARPTSSENDLNCSLYSLTKKKTKYGGRDVFPSKITKEMLDKYETYKYEKRKCTCLTSFCLRKCCGKGEAIDLSTKKCSIFNTSDEISFNVTDDKFKPMYTYNLTSFNPLFYGMECHNTTLTNRFYIQKNDTFNLTAFATKDGIGMVYDSNSFCLENVMEDNVKIQVAIVCTPNGKTTNLTFDEVKYKIAVHYFWTLFAQDLKLVIIYFFFHGLSTLFLLITFFVYATIPELRDTHGKKFMCFTASLITSEIFHVVYYFTVGTIGDTACEISGFIMKVFYFAVYFWLNTICIGIWRTFCYLHINEHRTRGDYTFLFYSCYAWICSSTVSLIIQYFPELFNVQNHKTGLCLFDLWKTIPGIYLGLGITGTLVLLNIVLFSCTAVKIFIDKRKLKILAKKHQWTLYLKLFIVMGMFWVIATIVDRLEMPKWAICIGPVCKALLGLCIFWVFVLSKKAKPLLKRNLENWYL